MNFFNKTKGAISIFLVIILVPMMTISSLFVDAGKVKLAKGVAESAGDLTLNTALTDYDTMLKDMYGLFATAQDTEELFGKLEDYYRTCITSSGVSEEDAQGYVDQIMSQLGLVADGDNTSDVLNMQLVDFDVSKRTDATLANATIMEKQIVDFMKYRAPINTGLSFISSIQSFSTLSKQTELVDKRQNYYKAQETVMNSAQEAWKYIYKYNQSGFVKDSNYFTSMKGKFANYSTNYNEIATKIIKDLYDTQDYDGFTNYSYYIGKEKVELPDGSEKEIPIFYTNSAKTSKRSNYTEYTTYSDENQATAANIKSALNAYNSAYNTVKTNESKLLEDNNNTYGLQYLVQTNRGNLYKNWVTSMATLYDKYCALRHAATYSGTNEDGVSVMTTSEKLFGESSAHPYSWYYDKFMSNFDTLAATFNQQLPQYSSKLQGYANAADTSTSGVEGTIALLYGEVTGYRTTISDAKDYLETAVEHLNDVYDGVKAGGTLETKQAEWKGVADDKDLKNTSMAKQDLAEIDSLSTYLNPTDVQNLIDRLNNMIGHLGDMLDQIDSYTFFGTKIVEISDYTTFVNLLKNKIGDSNLKNVPTDKTQLNERVSGWLNGKFVIGEAVNIDWENQSKTQANLTKDKPNFYSYLYTHFNAASVASGGTDTMKEDKENGDNLYKNIKDKSSSAADGKASGTDSGSITNTNELVNQAGKPSNNAGSDAKTAAAEVKTGDSAMTDTSSSLSSMFSSFSTAVVGMGTDLRDKLYVSDYILSMFSYDTIEKEYAVKNPGKDVKLQTLTLVPIDADHNFAYGKEVEYVIYGGTNASNLTKAYGSIYGIRLGFNLIYAFMDSGIRDTAFAIATPISAATLGVVPVPLIQAAIIIGISCCESAIDLNDIRNGESIPLFKNEKTWKCSVNGLINEAKGVAGSLIKEGTSYIVDESTRKLGEVLDMTDEELDKFIEGGADELTGYVEASYDTLITRHANTAIQKLTTLANNAIEEYALNPATDMVQYVSNGLDSWLAAEANGVDTSSDLGYIVKKEAVSIIKSQFISQVITALQSAQSNAANEINNIGATLTDKINEIRELIVDKVNNGCEQVKNYKSEMISNLKSSMEDGAESVKNTLNQQIDGIFGSGSVEGSDNTGVASLLSFSYSDYLRLFLMIGLYTNEEGILLRTADVVQANMAKATGNTEYRLSNSAVYVEINATIQVKPTLLALPLFADVEGNPSTNQKWYTIEYKSIKGY